jgi:predicted transcriptional regulator
MTKNVQDNVMSKYAKTERQLLLYEIIFTSKQIEIEDVMKRLDAGKKMIQRDIIDLTDAGLVKLEYSRKEKAYLKGEPTNIINEPQGTRRFQYLNKIVRLAQFMEELSSESTDVSLDYNCRTRYEEMFPQVSERTRMRDYKTLDHIGYHIRWDEYEKRHSVTGYLYQTRETFD